MKIRSHLNVSTLDPFTLLKILQILREISFGESLVLIVEGDGMTDDLFKILSPEKYQVVMQESETKTEHIQIVIHKIIYSKPEHPYPSSKGGSCCS